MKQINVALADELVEYLEKLPDRNKFIADALNEKRNRERDEGMSKTLAEGYANEKLQDREVDKEWESATLERWK